MTILLSILCTYLSSCALPVDITTHIVSFCLTISKLWCSSHSNRRLIIDRSEPSRCNKLIHSCNLNISTRNTYPFNIMVTTLDNLTVSGQQRVECRDNKLLGKDLIVNVHSTKPASSFLSWHRQLLTFILRIGLIISFIFRLTLFKITRWISISSIDSIILVSISLTSFV